MVLRGRFFSAVLEMKRRQVEAFLVGKCLIIDSMDLEDVK